MYFKGNRQSLLQSVKVMWFADFLSWLHHWGNYL